MDSTFELLKLRLVLRHLDEVEGSELHGLVLKEAHTAAEQARATPYPCLVFPSLLQERVREALERHARKTRLYWAGLDAREVLV